MSKVSVYNMNGSQVGEIELNDAVFGVEVNEHLVHMAVVSQLANNRQGTQSAKTRSEVSGGGKKPWKQKGTGHARQGSTRSPQWTGGGVVFAPKPRDYSIKLNKKEKQLALKSALTSRVNENKFIVVDEIKMDSIKTKNFAEAMKALNVKKALVVLNDMDMKYCEKKYIKKTQIECEAYFAGNGVKGWLKGIKEEVEDFFSTPAPDDAQSNE